MVRLSYVLPRDASRLVAFADDLSVLMRCAAALLAVVMQVLTAWAFVSGLSLNAVKTKLLVPAPGRVELVRAQANFQGWIYLGFLYFVPCQRIPPPVDNPEATRDGAQRTVRSVCLPERAADKGRASAPSAVRSGNTPSRIKVLCWALFGPKRLYGLL